MEEMACDPRVVFLGQGVRDPGTFMSTTLQDVPLDKRIEMPVMEETQLGMSIGMTLAGMVPVSIFPRWNFLLLAANQLVNHLDKMQVRVIVRVGIGSSKPLDPGVQHTSDFTEAFRLMMPNTYIRRLNNASDVITEYRQALERKGPSILVEIADLYAG
jgi:pyruvate/2-oxoglutarate/acetoin dehydrogenase E1 component